MQPGARRDRERIQLGAGADAYPSLQITRQVLKVLDRFSHPAGATTKSALVPRALDILGVLAKRDLVDPTFGTRLTGAGPPADLMRRRFTPVYRRMDLRFRPTSCRAGLFARPARLREQLGLFD